jgi:hypothetical protein
MVKICIMHNTMAEENGVWLKKLEDVTEIVRRNHYICSIERCPKCHEALKRQQEFLRGDNGKTQA